MQRLNLFLCFAATLLSLFSISRSAVSQQDEPQKTVLVNRFGEQQFLPKGGFVIRQGDKLPDLVWENPKAVASVVTNPKISTRWFNEQFEEVQIAKDVGRYYAYGEAPTPRKTVLRRAMTCCCISKSRSLEEIARKQIDDSKNQKQIADLIRSWRTTEQGAVELAALLFEADRTKQKIRPGQWQMENATRHVRLKRKLMGWDNKPIVKALAKPITFDPKMVLHRGSIEKAEVTQKQKQQIEDKIHEWFEDSREPMAIVIARNNVIVTAKGFGKLGQQPVTIDSPMLLHSAMKPLIGLQLATFVDRGILDLDEPIGKYLPAFATPRDRKLTFRAAHVHATGIHFPWSLAFSRLFYFHTWHEALIAQCKREWDPGTQRRYGVVGVILSVRVLELFRGRNYWDAMERDLFQPLGIKNIYPGGTGFSAENLARIGVLLNNRGRYGKWQVFSEKTHKAILPTSLKPYFPSLNLKYGIGFQDQSGLMGPGSYGHGGGCGTLLVVNPNKRLVFAMVRNGQGKDYRRHRSELMRILREIE